MKPQRNPSSPLSQLTRLRVSGRLAAANGGLRTKAYGTRTLGIPHALPYARTSASTHPDTGLPLLLLRSPVPSANGLMDDLVVGRTFIKHHGNNTRNYTNTLRDSNQQTHHVHPPEPSSLYSLHSGLFSCTTTGSDIRKGEPSSLPIAPYPSTLSSASSSSDSVSWIGQSPISPALPSYPISSTSNRCLLILARHPSPRRPMAFNTYSTASSDISTPRSSSPSSFSIASARSSHTSVSSKRLSLSLQRRQSALNPMSSVDISAIEEQMKMAALDGLRGYAQNHYGEVQQYRSTEYIPQSAAGGYQILREPLWNKGIAPSF